MVENGNARYGSCVDLIVNGHSRHTLSCIRGFAGLPGFKPPKAKKKGFFGKKVFTPGENKPAKAGNPQRTQTSRRVWETSIWTVTHGPTPWLLI